jgi:hypothetical protein
MEEMIMAKEPPPALHVTDYSMGVNEGGVQRPYDSFFNN